MKELVLYAPAKINLCLCVLEKRPDGYHEVEMLMQAVGVYDRVAVREASAGISVTCDAAGVPLGEGNIAFRAAKEVLVSARTTMGISIAITKNIPVAAGLGGGSSDAAAVLVACNELTGARLSKGRLTEIGTGLGMDVPFFFHGPTAVARGRGEVLETLPPPPLFWVLLVNPGFETPTAWVYQNLNLRLTKRVDCNKIARLKVGQLAQALHNDLETVTAPAHPVIGEMAQALRDAGALGARMSGSGPTVFGIFETEDTCRKAAELIRPRGWKVFPAPIVTEPLYGEYLRSMP